MKHALAALALLIACASRGDWLLKIDSASPPTDGNALMYDATNRLALDAGVAGASLVAGPGSSADNAVPRFDGTGGLTLQESNVIIDDSDNVTGVVQLTTTGNILLDDNTGDSPQLRLVCAGNKLLRLEKLDSGDGVIYCDEGGLRVEVSYDADDYLYLTTVGHVPTIGTQGACNLAITSSGGTIDFDDENLTTTGTVDGVDVSDHSARHESGGADAIKLDDLASPDDTTDLDATSSAHGLLPKLDNTTSHVLNGGGSWTPPILGHHTETLTDTHTMSDGDEPFVFVTPSGNNRQVTLPSAPSVTTMVGVVNTGPCSAATQWRVFVYDGGTGFSYLDGGQAGLYAYDPGTGYWWEVARGSSANENVNRRDSLSLGGLNQVFDLSVGMGTSVTAATKSVAIGTHPYALNQSVSVGRLTHGELYDAVVGYAGYSANYGAVLGAQGDQNGFAYTVILGYNGQGLNRSEIVHNTRGDGGQSHWHGFPSWEQTTTTASSVICHPSGNALYDFSVPNDTSITLRVLVDAWCRTTLDKASYEFVLGAFGNNNTVTICSTTKTVVCESDAGWDCSTYIDGNTLNWEVTGANGKTVQWQIVGEYAGQNRHL